MADKIVADYIVKTDEAVKNLNRLEKEVKDLQNQGKKSAKDIESNFKKTSDGLISQFSKVGAAIGVAFGAAELVSFGKEAVNVAAKSEGIERAFNKLNNPNLLADLRKATRGTVSDLELMQKAVQANNFKLPLDQLAKLFKFATDRAIETGESVDYLVESIVLGISRKSIPILDNLGISSVQIQEEMRKTGDFSQAAFNIIEREGTKSGIVIDTTSVKLARLTANWENFTKVVGDSLIRLGDFASKLEDVNGVVNLSNSALEERVSTTASAALATAKLQEATGDEIGLIKQLRIQLFGLNDDEELLIQTYEDGIDAKNKKNEATGDEINLNNESANSINRLSSELKELQAELNNAEKGSSAFFNILDKVNAKAKELFEAEALKNLADALKVDEEIDIDITVAEQKIFDLGEMLKEAFGTKGSDMIQSYFDTWLESSINALETTEERTKALMELEALRRQENREFFDTTLSAWQSLTSTVSTLVEAQYQRQSAALKNQLDTDQITREEYDRRRAQLAKENFKKDKEAKIIQASINTALGVTNAIATAPNIIVGLVLAAVAAAAGAAEIGVIASQPTPQFAEGGLVKEHGLLKGKSHARGGIQVEAEGDEFFVNKKATKKNLSLLKAINDGVGQEWINKNMVYPAIQNVIDSGVESNSGNWGNVTASLKDHNLIAAIDRDRSATSYGLNLIYRELKANKRKDRYA